ncbi:hypothetical protein BGW38_006583 [Lunasporangiospora selenospora]|uniref:Uncharacterized protein n=1 Tax=Lunasporangiospora selenospora TaxID=979761 RepID=A0A9P6G113_9FUNG|nr:hypothetical protein BGW38_006583 [Lunasporangiospora selenospora]
MVHKFEHSTFTYFDVKVAPDAIENVISWTAVASANALGPLAGIEYIGHVGDMPDHLLYRIPKLFPTPEGSEASQGLEELEDRRNAGVVDSILARQGVIHVDVQSLKQRVKRDEL